MYLKRIELEGFKSFADRTVLSVERGLTGIVGPNGCGKSNVVDALLWVLGERSVKALRADSMEDVIFKGAEGREPAPYSMVEVVLCDEEGAAGEPGAELAVGRRLFRNGESDYLLNGRRVKRREVRDLLLDTGLGVRGYMVLAQGKIDAVLSADSAARRSVFEEAAGISRYKTRKHETLLKLQGVAEDLARIEDVYAEVQKTVRSLKLQAGKARRFLETRERYRGRKLRLCGLEAAALQSEEQARAAAAAVLEERLEALRRAREDAEALLRSLEEEAEVLRRRHETLQAEASATKERIAGGEERAHGLEARAAELEQRQVQEQQRLARLVEEQRGQREAGVALAQEEAGLTAGLAAAAAERNGAAEQFETARAQHRGQHERVAELRSRVLELLAARTRHHNEAAAAAQRRGAAEGELRAVERRGGEAAAEVERVAAQQAQLEASLRAAQQRLEQGEGRARALVEQRDELAELAAACRARLAAAHLRASEAQARLAALTAVEQESRGLPDPVRAVLEAPPAGVAGLVLEGIRVAPPWDRLLENLLGRMQHGLWLQDRGALQALPPGGFDCFFPAPLDATPAAAEPAGAVPLARLLQGDAQRCAALCARLGEVYCVADAATARRLAEERPQALFLARDGELHGGGFARLGILDEADSAGLLARRNARDKAEDDHRTGEQDAAAAAAEEQGARERLDACSAALAQLDDQLREAVAEGDRVRARWEDCRRRGAAAAAEGAALAEEAQSLRAVMEQCAAAEQSASSGRAAAEERRRELHGELEAAEARGREIEQLFEEARARLQEARLEHERLAQRLAHFQERRAAQSQLAAREEQERRRVAEELAGLAARACSLRQDAEAGRAEVRRLLAARAEVEQRVLEAAEQMQRASRGLGELRATVDARNGEYELLLGQRQELALARQRVSLQREELERAVREEFQQPLADLRRAGVAAGDDEGGGATLEELRAEVAELRARLDSIGAVNLDAVQELQEREEREAFLARERDDLVKARANLEQSVAELDEHCRARFLETFRRVQEQFEGIFRRLFRGGKAELELEAGVDPLEAGVDIQVRPPGKELRSIKLLSGGERTLTALALLLAVFRSRPSPFCLLDEVDAALDDSNVGRFLDVLNDFVRDTQFLVVTHNKLTMARCERLFGVTMRKPGVSQVVAVDLSEIPENPLLSWAGSRQAGAAPSGERPDGRHAEGITAPGVSP